jgi:hypothetical protein
MTSMLSYAPVAAAAFGVPQVLPQVLKLRATHDTAGISWPWAALTSVNNAARIAYFALFRCWTALIPACSVTLLAGALTIMLTARGDAQPRSLGVISAWAAALAAVCGVAGRASLGTLLTAAFIVQVAPLRTRVPDGAAQRHLGRNLDAHPRGTPLLPGLLTARVRPQDRSPSARPESPPAPSCSLASSGQGGCPVRPAPRQPTANLAIRG